MASTATKKVKKTGSNSAWWPRHKYVVWIALFTFLLFANSLGNGYNMDDELVTINHRLTSQGLSALPEIFTSPYYQDAMGYSYEYRPMVLASFAIEHHFFGESPFVSHLFNLLLYVLLAVLFFKVMVRLLPGYTEVVSLAVTLLFVAHTSHTEVVCSIKNRDELLALFFGLLALRAALLFVAGNKWQLGAVFLFYTAALMSKVTIMSFVFILPLLLLFFTDISLKNYLLLLLAFALPTHFFITNVGAATQHALLTFGVLSVPVVFYFIHHRLAVFNALRDISQLLTTNPAPLDPTAAPELNWASFKGGFSISDLRSSLPAFLLGSSIAMAYFLEQKELAILLLGLTFGLYLFISNVRYAFWQSVLVFLVLLSGFALPILGLTNYGIGIVAFFFFSYYENSPYRSVLFVMGLLAGAVDMYLNGSLMPLLFIALLWVQSFKWGKWVLLLVVGVYVPDIVRQVYFLKDYEILFGSDTVIVLFTLVALLRPYQKIISRVLLLGLLTAMSFYAYTYRPALLDTPVLKTPPSPTATPTQPKDDNLIPIGTERPILFIEQAVQPTDPLSIKLGTSAVILLKYLQKVVVPYPLAFYYGYGAIQPTPLSDWRAVLSIVLHALLLLAALFFWHRDRLLSAGLWIYLLSIIFFANYFVPIAGMFADRFLLVPSLGLVLVLVSLLLRVFKLEPQKVTLYLPQPPRYVFIALLSFWSVLTFARNFDWKDRLTLMRKDVNYVKQSASAHNLLALNIMKSTTVGQKTPAELDALRQEALGHFKQSLAIYPKTFNVAYDIGRVYSEMNNTDSMIAYFQRATDLDPDHQLPELSFNLGIYYQQKNLPDPAIVQYKKTLQLQPQNNEAYSRLSYVYFVSGRFEEALATNRMAAFHLPTNPEPLINMAFTFQGMKNTDSMAYYFNLAEQRFPGHPVVLQAKKNLTKQ